jgi:hypothetical protein
MIVSFDSCTTGVTIGAGTTSPIGAPVFIFFLFIGYVLLNPLFFVDACVEHYSNTTGVTSGVGPVKYISSIILNI